MCLVEKNNGSTFQRSLLPFIFHFVQPIDRASRHFQKSSSPFFFYLRHEFAAQILRSSLNSSSIDRVDSYLNGDIVWRETTRRGKGTGREGKRERGGEGEGKKKATGRRRPSIEHLSPSFHVNHPRRGSHYKNQNIRERLGGVRIVGACT